jgi:16S rRNA (uracil1498-N3)-methyltransferase
MEAGDEIELRDGTGGVGRARISGSRKSRAGEWEMQVTIHARASEPPTLPRVTVIASPPKGDRLEGMVDALSQAGCAAFYPLSSARTVVHPREGKLERLERVARESLAQCGRAHLIAVGPVISLEEAIARKKDDVLIVADASGTGIIPRAASYTALIGPERGWESDELERLSKGGACVVSLGPHTMRIETAALAACVTLMRQA